MIVLMFGEQWDSLAEPSTISATVLWSLPEGLSYLPTFSDTGHYAGRAAPSPPNSCRLNRAIVSITTSQPVSFHQQS